MKKSEYNDWNIQLWLTSADEPTYRYCVALLKKHKTIKKASEQLYYELQGQYTPDGVKYTRKGIREALSGIKECIND